MTIHAVWINDWHAVYYRTEMKVYRRMYYALYKWGLKAHGAADLPQYNAMLGLSAAAFANVTTVAFVVTFLMGRPTWPLDVGKGVWVVGIAAMMAAHYLYLVSGSRFEEIKREFSHESPSVRPVVGYFVGTFVIVFGVIALCLGPPGKR